MLLPLPAPGPATRPAGGTNHIHSAVEAPELFDGTRRPSKGSLSTYRQVQPVRLRACRSAMTVTNKRQVRSARPTMAGAAGLTSNEEQMTDAWQENL